VLVDQNVPLTISRSLLIYGPVLVVGWLRVARLRGLLLKPISQFSGSDRTSGLTHDASVAAAIERARTTIELRIARTD
jgi:hypothetical protein